MDFGADINTKGALYGNALVAAAKGGHQAAVNRLTRNGAKLEAEGNEDYPTALYAASLHGHRGVVARLLQWGADHNQMFAHGRSALRAAVKGGLEDVVALLMEYGASLAQKNEGSLNIGELTLHMAAKGGHMELARSLLTFPCINANSPNEEGLSPLLIAASHGHINIIRLPLHKSHKFIDTTATDRSGSTALMVAANHGYLDMVRVILEHSAREWQIHQCGQGLHSLMIAVSGGNQEFVLLHLELGVVPWDVERGCCPYQEGVTKRPLITAIEMGHEAITFLLLQHGAMIDDPYWLGNKSVDLAISKGYRTIEKLLSFGDGEKAIAERDRWWKSVAWVQHVRN